MAHVIAIDPLTSLLASRASGGTNRVGHQPRYYMVHAICLRDDALEDLLSGKKLTELPQGTIKEQINVRAPDGAPAEPHSQGRPVITSLAEAIAVAKRALANPESEIRQKGFPPQTKIYEWLPNQPFREVADA